MNTIVHIALSGMIVGIVHFAIVGALYSNPIVARLYRSAEANEPGVRRWPSRGLYVVTQLLGTQVEVFILATAYFRLRPHLGIGLAGTLLLALLLAAVRVYPRFWNMWIQSTYPTVLLKVEFVNGIVSTFTIVIGLDLLARVMTSV
jgi:hypothetical protein